MPDPSELGVSVTDLASPQTIRERAIAWSGAVSVEEAGVNFRKAAQQLRDLDGHTFEEWQCAADGVKATSRHIAEEDGRG